MKLIDVSGLGHSGKTAVTDLLREVDGVYAHHNSFEFNILRLPDGISDLYYALSENWSPSRSDFAIKRFRKLCKALEFTYSEILTDRFMEYTDKYLESLVCGKLYIDGWYDPLYKENEFKEKTKTLLKNIRLYNLSKDIYNIFKLKGRHIVSKNEVYLSDGDNFIQKTMLYLEKILFSKMDKNVNTVITNNVFEPFSTENNFIFFNNPYSIIVDRDPRDIFASVSLYENAFIPEFEFETYKNNKKHIRKHLEDFLGLSNINTFIIRQSLYRKKINFDKEKKNIIYIHYEDLVLDYDNTVQLIFDAVGIDSSRHIKKKQHFDLEKSSKNVGIWKRMEDNEDIKLIEKELKDYLYTS